MLFWLWFFSFVFVCFCCCCCFFFGEGGGSRDGDILFHSVCQVTSRFANKQFTNMTSIHQCLMSVHQCLQSCQFANIQNNCNYKWPEEWNFTLRLYRNLQALLFKSWDKYERKEITATRLLSAWAHLNALIHGNWRTEKKKPQQKSDSFRSHQVCRS